MPLEVTVIAYTNVWMSAKYVEYTKASPAGVSTVTKFEPAPPNWGGSALRCGKSVESVPPAT